MEYKSNMPQLTIFPQRGVLSIAIEVVRVEYKKLLSHGFLMENV